VRIKRTASVAATYDPDSLLHTGRWTLGDQDVPVDAMTPRPEGTSREDGAPQFAHVADLGHDVFAIDTQMGGYDGITAAYLIRGSRPVLVETGTARSAEVVRNALSHLGIGPDDLATIVVTHIHLDHAGGVGDLAATYPRAEIAVHTRGARHLVDPGRLLRSARMVFGDTMDTLFGDLLPTEAQRVRAVDEGDVIDLGDGRGLDVMYAPGHASHHVALIDSKSGDVYTGDAAGVYVPETADVRPATPPPDFDLDLTLTSLAAIRARGAQRLLFSHFGPVTDVALTLDRSEAELHRWVEHVRAAYSPRLDLDHAVALVREFAGAGYPNELRERGYSDLEGKFEVLSSTQANVAGVMHWLDRD